MSESMIGGITGGLPRLTETAAHVTGADGAEDGRFGGLLQALTEIEAQADAAVVDLAVGGEMDLHDVVLAVEMESIAFELATQIRNRLVDAYQEVFRMSV